MKVFPSVSVLMSVYNSEQYVAEAIDSILIQTFTDFEFIIINDGSTDNSLEIIEKYALKDKRIVLISRENKGIVKSINEGLIKSKGRYIVRMDSDDISLPTRIEEQVEFMDTNSSIGASGCWIEIFGETIKSNIWKVSSIDDKLKVGLMFSVPFANPSSIIRKDILFQYKIKHDDKYEGAEDYGLWVELSKYTKYSNIQKVLLKYRYLESSVSRVADIANDEKRYQVLKMIFNQTLIPLKCKNSKKENKLHFILINNERVKRYDIDIQELNSYFLKIINRNQDENYYNHIYLTQLLGKKYLSILLQKKEFNILKYNFKLIFYGLKFFWNYK